MQINLNEYKYESNYTKNDQNVIFCKIRKKFIHITPEEIIRQKFVEYISKTLQISKVQIEIEIPISHFKTGAKGRADVIVYSDKLCKKPFLVIECKQDGIALSHSVEKQAFAYNQYVCAKFILLTNGNEIKIYDSNQKEIQIQSLMQLLEQQSFEMVPYYGTNFQRFRKEEIESDGFIDKCRNKIIPYITTESAYILGKETSYPICRFALKLFNLFMDNNSNTPILTKLNSKLAEFIQDGGVRLSTFGNRSGFDYNAPYRYFILKRKNENMILSFSIFSSGYPKYSYLMVGIDDFEQTHHSIQMRLDKCAKIRSNSIVLVHDGTLSDKENGRIKNEVAVNAVKNHLPELYKDGQIVLGSINVHKTDYYFNDEEIITLISNLIDYAILRDEIRRMPNEKKTATKKYPSHSAKGYLDSGNECMKAKKFSEAIQYYTKVIELDPKNVKAYMKRASAKEKLNDKEGAQKDLDTAFQINSFEGYNYYLSIGNRLKKQENYLDAILSYKKALSYEKRYESVYFSLGGAHFNLKNYEDAIVYYSKSIDLEPKYPGAFYNRGLCYYSLENHEEAVKNFSKAIKLKDENAIYWYYRGESQFYLNHYPEAILDFSKAIEIDNEDSVYFYYRGLCYYNLENYQTALNDLNRAIELGDEESINFYYRGLCYYNLENYQAALNNLNRAIEIDNEDSVSFYYRGLCYYNLENYQAALNDLNRAIELGDEESINFYYRGLCYYNLENYQTALNDLNRAIELNNEESIYFYYRGEIKFCLEDYKGAIEDYTFGLKIDPSHFDSYMSRGYCYFELKEYTKAIEDFNSALKIKQENSNIVNLIQLYFLTGQKNEAILLIDLLQKNQPKETDILAELYFYMFAHYPERMKEAENKLNQILEENKGDLISAWVLTPNIELAQKQNHPFMDKVQFYADQINESDVK